MGRGSRVTMVMMRECRNGHALTSSADVYVTPDGHRRCRTCKRQSDRRTRAIRNPAARTPNPPRVSKRKYRGWAMTVWNEMTEWDRTLLRLGIGEIPE